MTMTNDIICIQNNQEAEEFMETCILLLTHGVLLVCNSNREDVEICSAEVFKIMQVRSINIKIKAIFYFMKLFTSTFQIDASLRLYIINIFKVIQGVNEMFLYWRASCNGGIQLSELDRFNLVSIRFLMELLKLDIKYTNPECEEIILILCQIASNFYKEKNRIDQSFYSMCIEYLNHITFGCTLNSQNSIEAVKSLVSGSVGLSVFPDTLKLLEFCVMTEIKDNLNDNLSLCSPTLKALELILQTKLKDLGSQNSPEQFNSDLLTINAILKLFNHIEHSFLEFHQKHHLEHPCFCSKYDLVEDSHLVFKEFDFKNIALHPFNQPDLVKYLLEAINRRENIDLKDIAVLLEISFNFLLNSSSVNMEPSMKMILVSIIISPYNDFCRDPWYVKILTHLPSIIKIGLKRKCDTAKPLSIMQIRCLDLISGLSLKRLNGGLEGLNYNLFNFILKLYGEHPIKVKVFECYVSAILHNAEDLERYIELLQRCLKCQDILLGKCYLPHMKNIICLASKQAVVQKSRDKDVWQLNINCG